MGSRFTILSCPAVPTPYPLSPTGWPRLGHSCAKPQERSYVWLVSSSGRSHSVVGRLLDRRLNWWLVASTGRSYCRRAPGRSSRLSWWLVASSGPSHSDISRHALFASHRHTSLAWSSPKLARAHSTASRHVLEAHTHGHSLPRVLGSFSRPIFRVCPGFERPCLLTMVSRALRGHAF